MFRCTDSLPCYQGRDTGKSLQCRSTNMGERIQCGWFTYLWKKISYLLSSGVLIILELMTQRIPSPESFTSLEVSKYGCRVNWLGKKRNLIKHDAVWKDGHQCFVGSTYISSRLSFLYRSDGCTPYPRAYLYSFPGRRACIMFSLRQILSESCPLLLQNQAKSKISEEIITEIYSSIST